MAEEARLRPNIEDQLERLLSQLADLDELKSELSDEEYQSEKKSTLEQLTEFQATLEKICLLYTSPSPRDQRGSRMPSSA